MLVDGLMIKVKELGIDIFIKMLLGWGLGLGFFVLKLSGEKFDMKVKFEKEFVSVGVGVEFVL